MALATVDLALLHCDMAIGVGVLNVTTNFTVLYGGLQFATIFDAESMINITPMGLCMSLANPITAAQTAAALGVLTPGACIPVPTGMWLCPNVQVSINEMPMLDQTSTCICAYAGEIIIVSPECFNVILP